MMSVYGAALLVAAGVVGTGILVLPSILAVFGSWSIVGWVVAATMAYSIATIFGRLSKSFKGGAGPVQYIGETFGHNAGFLASWGYFFAMCCSASCAVIAFGQYALPLLGISVDPWVIGFIGLVLLFALSCFSSGSANMILFVLTAIKVSIFIILAIIGMKNIGNYNPDFSTPVTDVFRSASAAMFAFLGIEFASLSSGSVVDPEKNIMKATKLGLFFAAIAFIGVHCAVMFALPNPAASSRPVYDTAMILFGSLGAFVVGIIALISCYSTLHGILIVQANTVKNVSDSGWISRWFGTVNKQGFPWKGAAIFIAVVFLVVNSSSEILKFALLMTTSMVAILYLLSCLVDVKKNGWDFHNVFAILSCLLMLYNVNLVMFISMVIVYLVGFGVKYLHKRAR